MNGQLILRRHAVAGNIGQRTDRPHNRAPLYLIAFVAGSIIAVSLLWGLIIALSAFDRLPSPPVSGTWCIDSRFAWMKRTPQWKDARIIAVGSSVTWRNLDFEVTSAETKKQGVFNFAPCFLTMNQTRYLTEYILGRAAAARTVLTVLAPRDFEGCSRNRTAFFEPSIADRYIDSAGFGWWLYLRNLRLNDIFNYALNVHERRAILKFDPFGSGPLIGTTLDTGRAFKPEPGCYFELTELAKSLDAKGVQLIVATFPVMRAWSDRHDARGITQTNFKLDIENALSGTKAILVDGVTGWHVPDAAFVDPAHLQWPETADFTRFVWRSALQLGATLSPIGPKNSDSPHRIGSNNDRWGHLVNYRPATEDGPTRVTASLLRSRPHKWISMDIGASPEELIINTPFVDAVSQNTPGYSEAFAAGVPRGYSWCAGSYKPPNRTAPPAGFTSVTAWGAVYPKLGAPVLPSIEGAIEIANAKTYVYLKTQSRWVAVQDQAHLRMAGSHFIADFATQPGIQMKLGHKPDNVVAIGSPPPGYNSHFWPYGRGEFDADSVDGVYVQMDMRVTDPTMTYVANVGADWWRDPIAEYVEGFANNPGAGMSNWIELSTQWKTLRFYSWDNSRLQANPPPSLLERAVATTTTRRLNDSSAYCRSQSTK
ncbi:hypothetical protein [Pseudorhodoplanes sinuspersici]|uniref:Uncharacterized protein n=1 Tax=Pseudorhodoplanes sinuspersici TaxID=1235591 RepID=A0A1W6ZR88_9HYPH|nr:hypothetical protein [Pseudorhodoplanes sinuspersici]ARP99842.1 hypothetical protein CAK95_12685 [Pseudorhodoplanes sinuspersici]RKE70851.1 hypothetical protein DFP91_3101 [Pseudorhodoplanes sinuspersici]